MGYYQLYYHIVFRTKGSVPAIAIEHEKLFYNATIYFIVPSIVYN